MSGALTILVAKGQQDTVLTDNPQISFFRQNYKRHVNFSQAVLSQVIQGQPGEGATSTVKIDRKGDLLSYMYITKVVAPNETSGSGPGPQPLICEEDIEYIELLIGEQVIDTISTKQLTALSCFSSKYPRSTAGTYITSESSSGFNGLFCYPLGFWFCEHWQSALPLTSLQYHDVRLRIKWGSLNTGPGGPGDPDTSYQLWCNYIYLDNDERNYISKRGTTDTLMYQHQSTIASNSLLTHLPFNNPVLFLFTELGDTDLFGTEWLGDGATVYSPTQYDSTVNLKINGVDIVDPKSLYPHYNIIPIMYHTTYGKYEPIPGKMQTDIPSFIYPFALNCSQLQPSGTCNFSRIDSAYIGSKWPVTKPIYARSYNVLRIKNGMGGLLFSL